MNFDIHATNSNTESRIYLAKKGKNGNSEIRNPFLLPLQDASPTISPPDVVALPHAPVPLSPCP